MCEQKSKFVVFVKLLQSINVVLVAQPIDKRSVLFFELGFFLNLIVLLSLALFLVSFWNFKI